MFKSRNLRLAFYSLVIAGLVGILVYLAVALYIGMRVMNDSPIKSDIAIVLGAQSYIEGKFNPCLVSRVTHAVDLYKRGYIQTIVLSGGDDDRTRINESDTMREIALSIGMDGHNIAQEKRSTSTYENLVFTKALMEKNGWNSLIIVTEPFHMPRAAAVAKHLNLRYSLSPAIDSPCWTKAGYFSHYFLREPIAFLYYAFTGKM